jgi:hypothetical protein
VEKKTLALLMLASLLMLLVRGDRYLFHQLALIELKIEGHFLALEVNHEIMYD